MSSGDDRGAIDRYIAGAPVDADALAAAITAKAVDRAVVVEALLQALDDREPVVRRRTALRIARMPDLDPRLTAKLILVAGSDDNTGCREASAAALRTHGVPAPGEGAPRAAGSTRGRARLLLKTSTVRSDLGALDLAARYREDAPNLVATLFEAPGGEAWLDLRGLPPAFAGTRPVLRARVAAPPEPLTPIGRAASPVSTDGVVTIPIALGGASLDDLAEWLTAGVDLVA